MGIFGTNSVAIVDEPQIDAMKLVRQELAFIEVIMPVKFFFIVNAKKS